MTTDLTSFKQLRKALAACSFVIGSGASELLWIANSGIQGRFCWISKPGKSGIQFAILVGLETSKRAVPPS